MLGVKESKLLRLMSTIYTPETLSAQLALGEDSFHQFKRDMTDGYVLIVHVEAGVSKPYMDNLGAVWVKSGSDKRKVTAREELQRMFQQAALVHADEQPVKGSSIKDLYRHQFLEFFERHFHESLSLDAPDAELTRLLENMNLMERGELNLAGTLLFSRDIQGSLPRQFSETLAFVLRHLFHTQQGQSVNSVGIPEIPRIVLEELIANALLHRDYFVSAPVKLLVFSDRVEIISPGHLPNNLTIENIKLGNSNVRNPVLVSFAPKLLPYRGLGSGIMRALKAWPEIDLIDDRDGNLFKAVIHRPNRA